MFTSKICKDTVEKPAAIQILKDHINGEPAPAFIELITPIMALNLLEFNTNNRPINNRLVFQLKESIINGDWSVGNDAIMVATDGTILNGQHRLCAIYQSGIAVKCLIRRNVNHAEAIHIDSGIARSFKDACIFDKNIPMLDPRVGPILNVCITKGWNKNQNNTSKEAKLNIYNKYKKSINFVLEKCFPKNAPAGTIVASVFVCAHANGVSEEELEFAANVLLEKPYDQTKDVSSLVVLRRYLNSGRSKNIPGGSTRQQAWKCCQNMLHYYLNNIPRQKCTEAREDFYNLDISDSTYKKDIDPKLAVGIQKLNLKNMEKMPIGVLSEKLALVVENKKQIKCPEKSISGNLSKILKRDKIITVPEGHFEIYNQTKQGKILDVIYHKH